MALQIQMNTIDEAGTATPMYPINRTSDVIVGAFAAAADASLPGESESETLDASLSLIKAYLQKMKTAAYMNIAEELGNDTESVPTTAMVYDVVKDVKTALQTTGGEMTGFLSFASQSSTTGATAGLKFKCLTGSPGGQRDSTYEIRAISYSTPGGGSLYGAIGSNTLVPLNSDDSLGLNTKKWDTLHVSTICGFSLFGNMLPSEDGTRDIGSSTLRFKTGYFNKLSFKNSTYDESLIETYAEQYDRYDWRTGLRVGCSIMPGGYNCYLGNGDNTWAHVYANYINNLYGLYFINNSNKNTTYGLTYGTIDGSSNATGFRCEGTFAPNSNKSYDLGSMNALWNRVYSGTCFAGSLLCPDSLTSTDGSIGLYNRPYGCLYVGRIRLQNAFGESGQLAMITGKQSGASVYTSDAYDKDTDAILIGSNPINVKVIANYFQLDSGHSPSVNYSWKVISDQKVKTFEDDVDKELISKIIDLLDIEAYRYNYNNDGELTFGVNAQKLYAILESLGLSESNLNIVKCNYNFYLSRGDEEDDKFYKRFMTISYNDLYSIAIIKMQHMNKEIEDLKHEYTTEIDKLKAKTIALESKLAAIEARLG